MTGRAVGPRPHPVAPRQLLTALALAPVTRAGVEPAHRLARLEPARRGAMAIQAPAHGDAGHPRDAGHPVHAPVARHASHALGEVDGVVEVDVLRKLVDAPPADRLTAEEARAQPLEQR